MYINGKKIMGYAIPTRVDGLKIYEFEEDPSEQLIIDNYEDYEDFKTYDAFKLWGYIFIKSFQYNDQLRFIRVDEDQATITEYTFYGYTDTPMKNISYIVDTDYVDDAINEALGLPIQVATASEMDDKLTADNVGKIYKYTGENDENYETDNLYEIVEED